jgi:cation:H+ antiporter
MFESSPYLLFFVGALLLYYSSDILVSNAILISEKFNIPRIIIGGTIIALGTSLPEIIVSILANIKGNSNIVIGNIVGSNIANISFVFGISILFKKIYINKNDNQIYYNIFLLSLFTFIFYFIIKGGGIYKIHGLFLIILYIISFLFMIKYFKVNKETLYENHIGNNLIIFLKLILGSILIYYGSSFFIDGAIGISTALGIYDLSIGMTIVAFGTSAPELITSLKALKQDEHMLVIGNIIGSNISNIIFAAGISSLIHTVYFDYSELMVYNYIMLFVSIIFILMIYLLKNIHKVYGLLFISVYFIFIYLNFYAN